MLIEARPIETPIETHRGPIEIHRGTIEAHRGPTRPLSTVIEPLSDPIAPSRLYRGSYRGLSRHLSMPIRAHRGPIETPIEAHRAPIEIQRGPSRPLSRSTEALSRPIAPSRPYRRSYRSLSSPCRGTSGSIEALSRPISKPYRSLIEALLRSIEVLLKPIEAHRGSYRRPSSPYRSFY